MQEGRNLRKTREGVVTSNAMDKTIIVRVARRYRHPLYGKEMVCYKKFYAHDQNNEAKVGDYVSIAETKPLSKLKRWRLTNIIRKKEIKI